jgi:tetratricopeptide (TPR) repeat protein
VLAASWLVVADALTASAFPLDAATTATACDTFLEQVRVEYCAELDTGFGTFGYAVALEASSFAAEDFVSYSVGAGNAGPDESNLTNGECIFQTKHPIITEEECEALILEAKKVIAEGLENEGNDAQQESDTTQRTNSQLGEARVSQLPVAREWLKRALRRRFFPLLESRFGVQAADLTLQDALVIGYGYFGGGGSRSQPVHRDSSLLSLNVALSPRSNYEGGGTFFEGLAPESCTISNERGHVLCHAGGAPHAGRGIQSGERWVLVLFCIARGNPELARRCHARGIAARSSGNLSEAERFFRAGLVHAPRDHLLLTSLGGVRMAQNDETAARGCLALAAESYPHCTKAHMALGRMMLASRRPRAALRRFDAVLEWMQDRDLAADVWEPHRAVGFDARLYGAQSALLAAREAKRRHDNMSHGFDWRHHVEVAKVRSNLVLEASPDDSRIPGMLAFAEELLND